MLGMYIHTHWGYNRPYAARSWRIEEWEHYLSGLHQLGYDFIMVWPLFDSMSPDPNQSDREFLATLSSAIDVAHDRFGMRVAICTAGNTIGTEVSNSYDFKDRPYFRCEQRINPKDPKELATFFEGRRKQLEFLPNVDALAVIDSDPGGYVGSTYDEYVALMKGQIEALRTVNPDAELIYWMLCGWEAYNEFWAAQDTDDENPPQMWDNWQPKEFAEILALTKESIPEPWSVYAWLPEHVEAIAQLGLQSKAVFYPYGTIEGEPSFPLINCDRKTLAENLSADNLKKGPRGVLANAQTHCLQLPHTYMFAHFARGGPTEDINLAAFAEELIVGCGRHIARGWASIENPDATEQRAAAAELRTLVDRPHTVGPCAGLLLGSPDRFLEDLVLNLELRASLLDLKEATDNDRDIVATLTLVLGCLVPYQKRIGFVDAYYGTLYSEFNEMVARLGCPEIDRVLKDFSDWRDPTVRHGIVPRLLSAVGNYCEANR